MGSQFFYLLPGSGDFPAFFPAETGTRFSGPGGRKARWLTWVVVYPPKTVTYFINNRAVLWPEIEHATESRESNVLTTVHVCILCFHWYVFYCKFSFLVFL